MSLFFLKKHSACLQKTAMLIAFISLFVSAEAQEKTSDASGGKVSVTDDRIPEYPGGWGAFNEYMASNIKYPESSLKESVKGVIFLSFVVEKDGKLTNINISRGIGEELDKEVIRLIKISPKWRPAQENHIAVKQSYSLPISFPLEKTIPGIKANGDTSKIYSEVQHSAEFKGGSDSLSAFVKKSIPYPASAIGRKVKGKVLLEFVVEKDGSLSNVFVLRGIGNGCDEAACNAFRASPKWTPAQQNGVAVRQLNYVSLAFSLPN